MNNKTAVVIGGHGGIGAVIAKEMVKAGFNVHASYHTSKVDLPSVKSFQMDVTDQASVQDALGQILKGSPIDVVVFSVTPTVENKPLLASQWGDYTRQMDVQVKGLFHIAATLKDQLKSKHKTKFIVVLTEYCLGKPPALVSHYVSAKYALMGLSKAMAVEFARYNSTVNMVSPGMTQTALLSTLPAKLIEITAEKNPMGRIANPEDVAGSVLFLAGPDSDYLNGVNIPINGGELMQ